MDELPAQRFSTREALGRHWSGAAAVAAVVAVGLILRLAAMRPNILHVDEALFASFGRSVAERMDLLLLDVGFELDRPPLFFWILGVTIASLGDTAQAIRIPNLLFAAGTIVLAYVLARDLGGGRTGGLLAAFMVALSPFAILFGPTVFEEPGAVALGVASLVLVVADRPRAAGLMLGLAVAVKLFAAAFLPLAVGLALLSGERRRHTVVGLVVAFSMVVGALLGFMLLRTVVFGAPWFLTLQYEHVGGTRLLPPEAWAARLEQWAALAANFAIDPAALVVALGLILVAARSVVAGDWRPSLLVGFGLAYVALLTIVEFPIYDRYLLYALPPLAVAASVGIAWGLGRIPPVRPPGLVSAAAVLGVLVAMWPGAASAVRLEYYVADAGQRTFDGYERVCNWLIAHPAGDRVVWNHSLSWHFLYCLAYTPLTSLWYPDVDAIDSSRRGAYLAETQEDAQVVDELQARGWNVTLAQEFLATDGMPNIRIYRLRSPDAS